MKREGITEIEVFRIRIVGISLDILRILDAEHLVSAVILMLSYRRGDGIQQISRSLDIGTYGVD